MAGTLKKVRLTVACGYGDVGHEFTPTGMVRDWLLGKRWAVIVDEADSHEAAPTRPAKIVGKAAKKITDATKSLFGGSKQ